VDEVAEDRQRGVLGVLHGQGDGVTDAEAHAEVRRAKDAHTLQRKAYVFCFAL